MANLHPQERGAISVRNLSKSFVLNGQRLNVLNNLNINLKAGKVLAIVGPSGCGKTTLLRLLAGLEEPDNGEVTIGAQPVHGLGRERAVIFQEPRLLPWLSVLDNVSFGLEVQGVSKDKAREVARDTLRLVKLAEFERAWPGQLSGGMAQRVGIARALAVQPEILLLDEPLGALDAITKIKMQEELVRIWQEENITMILVTHDLEEAIYLADQVLILPKEQGVEPKQLDIDLPRPRERSQQDFVGLRQSLMTEFGLH
ncbi:sulfonate ABC transporter ATP-binding protein [Vibrio furnissii]|uniref:Sulfonate ABC transporter ATP-binding protein n=1 Tax=Vibrio furnissii TaxID=29494 RepID=A0A0Q2M758_VIBFU|nr:ABC transporter ATP-binding protein [Vibrio furnissii]KQH83722.1 sulfonate ABC transporter ATP-binding protein [Vibrio furnissii]